MAKKQRPGKKQAPAKDDKAFLEGLRKRRKELQEDLKEVNEQLELLKGGMSRLKTLQFRLTCEARLIENNIDLVDSQIAELDSPKRG